MKSFFPEVHKNFGFGCMRLPLLEDKSVDEAQFCQMIDAFLEAGFNYFDTARPYLESNSERALRECLVRRHPRDSYLLVNKLSGSCFEAEADIRPFFETQLELCGVDYFDFYLMHSQHRGNYGKFTETRAYEIAQELKAEGKIRHVGISFHDTADILEQILTDHPELEAVQLQFNYVDYEDAMVQSKACYDVCVKHGKPVIVMEPVKGGTLVNLPEQAQTIVDELHGGSNASYAIRFAASHENIMMVLSGMSDLPQMMDNLSFMRDFQPLTEAETAALMQVRDIFRAQQKIPCTACRYCVKGCPMEINIPGLFSLVNSKRYFFYDNFTKGSGKASDCIGCGQCENICPQHLEIRRLLKEADEAIQAFEAKSGR